MIGAQKISELNLLTKDNTELVPVIQDDGAGGWINGKLPITDFGTNTNLGNQDLTQTLADAVRLYDINGNILQFDNGQVVIGTPFSTTFAQEINGATANALYIGNSAVGIYIPSSSNIGGYFEGANFGIDCYSSSKAIRANTNGTAIHSNGNAHIETYSFAGTKDSSAVLQLDSNTQGALMPRMTTTQRDAISSPATSLVIFNTTTGRFEHYNGTYWAGEKRILHVNHPQYNPADSQTNFFSNIAIVPVTTTTAHEVILRGNGVIRACDFNTWASTGVGTNEAFSLYVRINSTDYLVQTISAATQKRSFVNTSLNIPFVDGDVLRMNYVTPAWATNPTGLVGAGNLIIE